MDGHYFFEKNLPWTALLGPGRLLNFDLGTKGLKDRLVLAVASKVAGCEFKQGVYFSLTGKSLTVIKC